MRDVIGGWRKRFSVTNKVISFGAGAVALFAILEDPE
jgi:hypothetical protein